ncbi:MAG: hypothetical protein IIZ45_02985, partial [Firmicutes bacterium]|nr:hypothetical protein [Bacillota bacterium]
MIGSDFKCTQKVSSGLDDNIGLIMQICGHSMDIIIRRLVLPNGQRAAAFLIDGLADSKHLGRDLFMPLTRAEKNGTYSA